MEITIWRRHSKDCPDRDDRYAPRCGCPLAFQFNWIQASTTFDGKKLKRGQNKWSANTRSMSEAQRNARKLENDLEDLLQGKQVRHGIAVETAIKEWWQFREKSGLGNTKAKLMGQKLIDWCQENDVLLITAFTTDRAMKFRMSLPFRTGDSNSLKVHWSVIGGFFSWAVGMGYIDKTPIPNARQFPQFKIVVKKREVKPPTTKQVENVLAAATGRVKVLCELMRWSAMALVDAQKFGMSRQDAEKFGLSQPERRPVLEDGTLVRGNRTKTNERYRVRIPQRLAEQLKALGNPAFPGTYREWRERCYKVFKDAGVKMTPHGFRHFRVSEWLSQGVRPEDVAAYVGTSPKEIRETYHHWIKEYEDRLDEVQRQAFLKQGLDENGNQRRQRTQ
jgi:integrase